MEYGNGKGSRVTAAMGGLACAAINIAILVSYGKYSDTKVYLIALIILAILAAAIMLCDIATVGYADIVLYILTFSILYFKNRKYYFRVLKKGWGMDGFGKERIYRLLVGIRPVLEWVLLLFAAIYLVTILCKAAQHWIGSLAVVFAILYMISWLAYEGISISEVVKSDYRPDHFWRDSLIYSILFYLMESVMIVASIFAARSAAESGSGVRRPRYNYAEPYHQTPYQNQSYQPRSGYQVPGQSYRNPNYGDPYYGNQNGYGQRPYGNQPPFDQQ